ncbi:molybdate ABC transporter substrate-binding protein [Clostridiaceae bacterium 35-E11]
MKKLLTIMLILSMILAFVGCQKNAPEKIKEDKQEITVSAAASLMEALTEIQPQFEKESGVKLTLNFAASGTLRKQIEEGAPVDLFISASQKHMDGLENKNLLDQNSRKNILKNQLVFIVAKDSLDKIKNISDTTRENIKISIGEPESVPAGQYAKESLAYLNLWDQVKAQCVYAKNVKQVVNYVESQEIDAGIVYRSDATVLKNSEVIQVLEEASHKPIVYPAAIIASSKNKDAANKFSAYLSTKEAQKSFEKYGFDIYEK